jgi:hypothetical protein
MKVKAHDDSFEGHGPVQAEPVRYKIDDLWRMSDARGQPGKFMSFEQMNEAKARRQWQTAVPLDAALEKRIKRLTKGVKVSQDEDLGDEAIL